MKWTRHRKKVGWRWPVLVAAVLLIAFHPLGGSAAEIWSEVEYTPLWSETIEIEQNSRSVEPPEPIPWIDPDELFAPPPAAEQLAAEPSLYIRLQIGSKHARVQDQDIELGTPPITIDGHTMVPFRFLGDALQADVGWQNDTRTVTLKLQSKTVALKIGESVATVNGRSVPLASPAVIKEGSTLVPLRFVSENLDLFVNYIASSKTIEISDQPFADTAGTARQPSAEAPGSSAGSQQAATDDGLLDFEKLYGTWYIWTAGSITNLYDTRTGEYATHDYTQGADQGKIVINKDGTYSMSHAAWDKGTTVEGKWRLTFPNEMTIDRKVSIVLLDGITGANWNVTIAGNGKIQLRYAMDWADGSVTWIHDSELYKK